MPRAQTCEQNMDVTKILAELKQEREQIEEAILTLERLALGRGKRRGRPPAWMAEAKKRTSSTAGPQKNPSPGKSAVA